MKTDRQKAMIHIKRYLSVFRSGEQFYGIILADYVKEKIGKKEIYPDTILRYMRTLKADGDVNFKVVNKRESKYVKV